jgi:hypothetical protein
MPERRVGEGLPGKFYAPPLPRCPRRQSTKLVRALALDSAAVLVAVVRLQLGNNRRDSARGFVAKLGHERAASTPLRKRSGVGPGRFLRSRRYGGGSTGEAWPRPSARPRGRPPGTRPRGLAEVGTYDGRSAWVHGGRVELFNPAPGDGGGVDEGAGPDDAERTFIDDVGRLRRHYGAPFAGRSKPRLPRDLRVQRDDRRAVARVGSGSAAEAVATSADWRTDWRTRRLSSGRMGEQAKENPPISGGLRMRLNGVEPSRVFPPTRPSTLRVYQFRHSRLRAADSRCSGLARDGSEFVIIRASR